MRKLHLLICDWAVIALNWLPLIISPLLDLKFMDLNLLPATISLLFFPENSSWIRNLWIWIYCLWQSASVDFKCFLDSICLVESSLPAQLKKIVGKISGKYFVIKNIAKFAGILFVRKSFLALAAWLIYGECSRNLLRSRNAGMTAFVSLSSSAASSPSASYRCI